jgi:hypothetical protein
MFFNYEKCEILDGRIEMSCDGRPNLLPFFNKNPQSDFTKIQQFEGGIVYSCEIDETEEYGLFKISFKKNDKVQLIQKYARFDSPDFFFTRHDKILVQRRSKLEIINHVTKEVVATLDVNPGYLHSNVRLKSMIYSPDFDSIPKFIISFKRPRNINEDIKSSVRFVFDDINIYIVPNYDGLLFYIDRMFSIEHAAINNDYALVKGLTNNSNIFQFAFTEFGENYLNVCRIEKEGFKMKELKVETHEYDIKLHDIYMGKILVRCETDNLRIYDISNFGKILNNRFFFVSFHHFIILL